MSSIFTKIINKEIPAYIIAEDDDCISFLDAMPLVEGHTLVIPKKEVDFIFDMEADDHQKLWSFAQRIAKKLEKVYPNKRVVVAVVGLEVPHAHIHLIPVSNVEEMNFKNERLNFTPAEYETILHKIKN